MFPTSQPAPTYEPGEEPTPSAPEPAPEPEVAPVPEDPEPQIAAASSTSSSISMQLVYPTGNPTANPAPASSEFVYSRTGFPGELTIQCRVRISPNTQAERDRVANKIRFTIQAIGTSHTSGDITSVRWNNPWVVYSDGRQSRYGKGVYDSSTGTFNATATFRGLPRHNSDFGQKNVKVQLMSAGGFNGSVLGEDSTVVEVFYSTLGNNHPGLNLNAVAADYGTSGYYPGAYRSPNWFYYGVQALGNNQNNERSVNDRYGGPIYSSGVQGLAPAIFFYQHDYSGRYGRTLIFDPSRLQDGFHPNLPAGDITTGIDTFRDKIVHERYHTLRQSLHWTNLAFGYSRVASDNVSKNSWSFNLKPGASPTSAGRKFNHKTLDADEDDVLDSEDPDTGFGLGDLEYQAYAAENNSENALAFRDWGSPGKNHARINDYTD